MPCDYSDYPENWKTWIRPQILERAENKCEICEVKNYSIGCRDIHGTFIPMAMIAGGDFENICDPEPDFGKNKPIKIVLTVAHMDHDLSNNDHMDTGGCALPYRDANLRALCQKCHLNHDQADRIAKRKQNKKQLELGL